MKRGHENSNISGDIKLRYKKERKVQIPEIKVQIRIRKVNWQEKKIKKNQRPCWDCGQKSAYIHDSFSVWITELKITKPIACDFFNFKTQKHSIQVHMLSNLTKICSTFSRLPELEIIEQWNSNLMNTRHAENSKNSNGFQLALFKFIKEELQTGPHENIQKIIF